VKLSEGKGVHAKAQRRSEGAKGCPIGVGILDEGYKGDTMAATRTARAPGFGIDGRKEPIRSVALGLRVGHLRFRHPGPRAGVWLFLWGLAKGGGPRIKSGVTGWGLLRLSR
jgi:hypothetical protein